MVLRVGFIGIKLRRFCLKRSLNLKPRILAVHRWICKKLLDFLKNKHFGDQEVVSKWISDGLPIVISLENIKENQVKSTVLRSLTDFKMIFWPPEWIVFKKSKSSLQVHLWTARIRGFRSGGGFRKKTAQFYSNKPYPQDHISISMFILWPPGLCGTYDIQIQEVLRVKIVRAWHFSECPRAHPKMIYPPSAIMFEGRLECFREIP